MSKLRWILILGNAAVLTATGLCLWLPTPRVEVAEPGVPGAGASPFRLHRRDIPAPHLERSLFRSQSDGPPPEPKEASSAPEMRLAGVLISDDIHVALVEQQDSALQRIREGDEI